MFNQFTRHSFEATSKLGYTANQKGALLFGEWQMLEPFGQMACVHGNGFWEAWISAYFANSIRRCLEEHRSCCVFDVGANIGYYSLLAFAAGATTVLSVEPDERAVSQLRQTMMINRHLLDHRVWRLEARGLMPESGKHPFYPATDTQWSTFVDSRDREEFGEPIETECSSLIDLCRIAGEIPNIVKIDTEGAEREFLLQELPNLGPGFRQTEFLIEFSADRYGTDFDSIWENINRYCTPYAITAYGDLVPYTLELAKSDTLEAMLRLKAE